MRRRLLFNVLLVLGACLGGFLGSGIRGSLSRGPDSRLDPDGRGSPGAGEET